MTALQTRIGRAVTVTLGGVLAGTGVLGGLTTCSAQATATAELALDHLLWWPLLYGGITAVFGAGLGAAGAVARFFLGGIITTRTRSVFPYNWVMSTSAARSSLAWQPASRLAKFSR